MRLSALGCLGALHVLAYAQAPGPANTNHDCSVATYFQTEYKFYYASSDTDDVGINITSTGAGDPGSYAAVALLAPSGVLDCGYLPLENPTSSAALCREAPLLRDCSSSDSTPILARTIPFTSPSLVQKSPAALQRQRVRLLLHRRVPTLPLIQPLKPTRKLRRQL